MTQRSRQTKRFNLPTVLLMTTVCTVLSGVPLSANAVTYRWVDDNGVVNYSERKPKNVPANRVTVVSSDVKARSGTRDVPTTPAPTTLASNTRTSTNTSVPELPQQAELSEDQQAMLEKLQQAEAERQATVAQIKSDNCERSRRVLSNLSQNGRLKVSGKDGTVRVLSEEERQKGISDAQRGIAENCSS